MSLQNTGNRFVKCFAFCLSRTRFEASTSHDLYEIKATAAAADFLKALLQEE